MARKATGQVVETKGKRGVSFALRFRALGKRHYVTLGCREDGWTRQKAEEELQNILADVRRDRWRPQERPPEPEEARPEPSFHKFASEWLAVRQPELAAKTVAGYRWALVIHLLPAFAPPMRLSEITVQEVDRYKSAKAREGRLGHAQINKTLKVLAMILETAQEYGHLDPNLRNPASGRRRRLKEPKPRRTWVEPEQLPTLLDAADPNLRPILATLAGAGLRIGEAVALRWRDVNVATGTITVRESKTDAGTGREVDLPLGLADELRTHKARCPRTAPSDRVFVNRSGRHQTIRNVEARIKTAVSRANEHLEQLGIEPLSARVTPHSLRRTYASLRFAKGDDSVQVAEQLGHTDGAFSQSVYAKAVKRRQRLSGNYLAEFDRALDWAEMGRNGDLGSTLAPLAAAADPSEMAGLQRETDTGPDSSAG